MIAFIEKIIKHFRYKYKIDAWRKKAKKSGNLIMKPESIMEIDKIQLGKNIYIGPKAFIMAAGGVEIHDNVRIGPKITIWTENHNYKSDKFIPYDSENIHKKVIIHENVWIGLGVMLCPGAEIGEGAIVSMGSVVHGYIPPCAIVAGNPAKIVGNRNEQLYYKLKSEGKIFKRWEV